MIFYDWCRVLRLLPIVFLLLLGRLDYAVLVDGSMSLLILSLRNFSLMLLMNRVLFSIVLERVFGVSEVMRLRLMFFEVDWEQRLFWVVDWVDWLGLICYYLRVGWMH